MRTPTDPMPCRTYEEALLDRIKQNAGRVSDTDDASKVHLLTVDDDPDSAELISRVAKKCGYDPRSITDTRGIEQMLSDWKPQVITLDLCMPEMDRMQILSLLQNKGFTGHLVIISGQTEMMRIAAQRLAEARGLKVTNNLSKPMDLTALSNLLASLKFPR